MDAVVNQILSLFLVGIIGFYGRKRNIIDAGLTNGLSKLLLEITTPLLIISSFNFSGGSQLAGNALKAFIYGLAIFIVTPIIVKPFFAKIEKRKRYILQFAMVFSNCGYMGIPLTAGILGDEGIIYASIFNMYFNIFAWTYGVSLFTDAKELNGLKTLMKNRGIIAVIIGLIVMIFSIQIPGLLLDTMKTVGGLTTPLSMIIIGSLLAATDFRGAVKDLTVYYGSFIKLILLPTLLYLVSVIFKENSLVMKTFILMQAMPAGAMTTLFAERFDKEKEYSAVIVSFSTLISMVTIPLVIKLFF
ncbi:AEC family transporter [Clostridium thermarum]|uniref:AEC family transporter n=1 Tax=Clostridium thermarum TaxID=1716543 RepID=UPI001FA95B94|nr:AEC family transporter [Clostridium thermarum]